MAIEKEIKIRVDAGEADKSIKEVKNDLNDLGDAGKEGGAKAAKGIKGVEDASKATTKASKLASTGVKAIGGALKAVGIGLVLALFAKFVEVLTKNQKVADALSVVVGTVGNVFTALVDALINTFDKVNEATNGFDAFGKIIKSLLTLSITPLKLAFFGIKLGVQQAQLAWEKSVFGSGDTKTIDKLNASIKETQNDLKGVAKDAVQAGIDIKDNVVQAVADIIVIGAVATSELSKVSISAANENAKLSNQLKNAAIIAEVQLQGLIEKYDRQAELLRQTRDDESKSISERIKANDELGKVLEEQAKEQKKLAGIRVSAAAQELSLNKGNVEAQKELIAAQNELAAIDAAVTGFRSEQLTNENSLLKEKKEIIKELNQIGKDELELAKQEAAEERDARLAQIELQVEDDKEKFRLLEAARKDYDEKIKELNDAADEKEQERQDQIDAIFKEREAKEIEDKFEKARAELEAQKIADIEKLEQAKATEDEINRIKGIFKQKADNINEDEANFKEDLRKKDIAQAADASSQVLSSITQLVGEGSKVGKTAAIASATIDTIGSAIGAYNSVVKTPFVGPVLAPIAAGVAAAAGLKSIKEIVKVKTPGGGAGGSVPNISTPNQGAQAPAFNLTASSGVNQLAGDVEGAAPVRAFVVGSDVTNQQEMDRATFGQAAL